MRKYELMYIVRPDLEQEAIDAMVARFQDIINSGGEVTGVEMMGKRRLAYEIQKFRDGFYVLVKFNATPETVAELDRVIRITDGVIRYLITKDVA